jgi:hypothetical protein
VGDFTAFSGCAGERGCFEASAIAPAVAFPLFATIFLTDFLLAMGLADKSIFVAGSLAESTLTPAVVAASVCDFGVSLGESTELEEIVAIGVPSGLTKMLRTGSGRAVCEAVSALPAAAFTRPGVSVVVAAAVALGPSAGRCASFAADVFAVDSWALISASLLPTSICSGSVPSVIRRAADVA